MSVILNLRERADGYFADPKRRAEYRTDEELAEAVYRYENEKEREEQLRRRRNRSYHFMGRKP